MLDERTSCLGLGQFPPTSNAINLRIYCAYLQAYICYHATIKNTVNIDPELHGLTRDKEENLIPIINDASP